MWNEQIVFTEMFPPLCQVRKLSLRYISQRYELFLRDINYFSEKDFCLQIQLTIGVFVKTATVPSFSNICVTLYVSPYTYHKNKRKKCSHIKQSSDFISAYQRIKIQLRESDPVGDAVIILIPIINIKSLELFKLKHLFIWNSIYIQELALD